MDVHPTKHGIFIAIDPYPGSYQNGSSHKFVWDLLDRFDSYPIFSHKWKNLEGRYHGILRWSFELTAVEIFRILHELFILSWEKWCFIMIYDDLWWFMMIYAHKSGSGINQYSLLVSPLIPSQHLVILGSRSAAGPDHSAIAQGFL